VGASDLWHSGRSAAEIVAVASLSSYRGRGLASSLSAALARSALAEGNGLVFLSAADDRVAAIYARIGFKQVETACIAEMH
jgi:predicted GNAT family acetyltransferase